MSERRYRMRRWLNRTLAFAAVLVVSPTFAPQLLAWPYHAERGTTHIYSVTPIPPDIDAVLARADGLLAQSPVHEAGAPRTLFLTDGGWRWTWLALTSRSAFAVRRPLRDAIVVNASDIAADRVANGAALGGTRSLSGVIAHETTHVDVADRYGEFRAMMLPTWKSEGYADHVARESSLGDADYRRLRAAGASHPALPYYEGRRRVEAILARNGGDVNALMRGTDG